QNRSKRMSHWLARLLGARKSSKPRRTLGFDTLDARITPSATHFAAVGDYGVATTVGAAAEASVANLIKSWNPDYIITLGDNNYYTGSAAEIDANIGQFYHDYIGDYVGTY